jgi:hypothetical protein
MEMNKVAVKAILVTLGAAFVLLSVNEWKKLVDEIPSDNGNFGFYPMPVPDLPNSLVCQATQLVPIDPTTGKNGPYPTGTTNLSTCQGLVGSSFPWTQAIKAFVYTWIGVGLLVAAFIKPKAAGVSGGGYW